MPLAAGRVGLYQVDPLSLEAVGGASPITTGDRLYGTTSQNGEWVVVTVWIDTPETDMIRVINVADQAVVSETKVLVPTEAAIADNGVAYWLHGGMAPFLRLHRLRVGEESSELIFNDFPLGFESWSRGTILDNDRIAFFGIFGPQTDEDAPALVILDLVNLTTTTYPLPEVMVGEGDLVDFGEISISEWFQPEVGWDSARNMAYVVHGDRDAFTAVDLTTGESNTRDWAQPTSWLGRVLAWLMPPAQAKGPNLGARRSVGLSSDGATLYVGTTRSHIETESDTGLTAVWEPQGIVAIDTATGDMRQHWSIPASEVHLAPGGEYLVATGLTVRDSLSTSSAVNEGAFIIHLPTGEVTGHILDGHVNGNQVQFSLADGIAYRTNYSGTIEVVDLRTAEVLSTMTGGELAIFGEAGLLATRQTRYR